MLRFVLYCLPIARRIARPRIRPVTRIRRTVSRGAGIATAAKIGAVAVAVGGPVCFLLPVWGGGAPQPLPVIAAPAPALYGTDGYLDGVGLGGAGFGGFGGPLDGRDFAALVPSLRPTELLTGTTLLPLEPVPPVQIGTGPTPPVTDVPEPSTLSILAAGIASMLWFGRRRGAWTPTGRTRARLFGAQREEQRVTFRPAAGLEDRDTWIAKTRWVRA